MQNYKLTIEYDGTAYHGWQRQKNDPTIQGEIENALAVMTRKRLVVNGSGRTDAGVHALGQTANFKSDAGLSAEAFQMGLNSLLKDDIVIKALPGSCGYFHARYDARGKSTSISILNRKVPSAIDRHHVWHIRKQAGFLRHAEGCRPCGGGARFQGFRGDRQPAVQHCPQGGKGGDDPGFRREHGFHHRG